MDQETTSQRVKFGELPNQDIPLSWAEDILRRLFMKQRKTFGNLLRETIMEMEPMEPKA